VHGAVGLRAFKELEERFGKKHPALESFKEPAPAFSWLPNAFFRLHRRRQHGESGFQPLPIVEITQFADLVLGLEGSLRTLFVRCMEETDNAVLYDHYTKSQERAAAAALEAKNPRSRS
jgi:hypothetical protein